MTEGLSIASGEIRWFGDRVPGSAGAAAVNVSKAAAAILYNCFYTVSQPITHGEHAARLTSSARASLTQTLQDANPGTGRREGGWVYTADLPGQESIVATKDRLSVAVPVDRLASSRRSAMTVGQSVEVAMPAGSPTRSPGYYIAHSNRDLDYSRPLARLYINVSPAGVARLMSRLCGALNDADLPFDFKAANDQAHYYRCDSTVLYVPRDILAPVLGLVVDVIDGLAGMMRLAVPAFVHQVRPGLGAADDPANGESFGMDRCRRIAEAIAAVPGPTSSNERHDAVVAAFKQAGIDPRRPYLGPGLTDIYGG